APECPDMVFTANAGIAFEKRLILSNFRHPQRQLEAPHFRAWFEHRGYTVDAPPCEDLFEGEGDALFAGNVLLAGYLKRSDIAAHRWIADRLGVQVLSLELVDDRWYHLDTCLFPLTTDTVVYYPGAFDSYGVKVIEHNFKTIRVETDEALRFACNAINLGRSIVMPAGCPRIGAALQDLGYEVHAVELSEFLKAGGAAKCLVLYLRQPLLTAASTAFPNPGP
ncbi:MAG TPA: arginine deiminase-related protein, partial [Chthonomonadales bacterium]|nr:arginine deiminase-related protein [Chthonomonadales bacterium]